MITTSLGTMPMCVSPDFSHHTPHAHVHQRGTHPVTSRRVCIWIRTPTLWGHPEPSDHHHVGGQHEIMYPPKFDRASGHTYHVQPRSSTGLTRGSACVGCITRWEATTRSGDHIWLQREHEIMYPPKFDSKSVAYLLDRAARRTGSLRRSARAIWHTHPQRGFGGYEI